MRLFLAVVIVVVVALLFLPVGSRAADEASRPVRVINFPALFKIEGQVQVPQPVPHSALWHMKEVTVPPVEPAETGRLIDGGTIDASGFTTAVLSLSGRASGRALRSGVVGAYLVPDEEAIAKAYDEDAMLQFPIEISAPLQTSTFRLTAMQQSKAGLGFPRYRVRFYNTTDRTVTVNLFAYLTQ
jgi:hypothetical protein